jgi:hypothetical protein
VRPEATAERCAHEVLQWASDESRSHTSHRAALLGCVILGGTDLDSLLTHLPPTLVDSSNPSAVLLSVKVELASAQIMQTKAAPTKMHWVPGHLKTRGKTEAAIAHRATVAAAVHAVVTKAKHAISGSAPAAAPAAAGSSTAPRGAVRVAAAANPHVCRSMPLYESPAVVPGSSIDFGCSSTPAIAVLQERGKAAGGLDEGVPAARVLDAAVDLGAVSKLPRSDWQALEGHVLLHVIARCGPRHFAVGHACVRVCDIFAGAVRAYAPGASMLYDVLHKGSGSAASGSEAALHPAVPMEFFVRLRVPLDRTDNAKLGTSPTVAVELSIALPSDVPLEDEFFEPDRDFLHASGGVMPPASAFKDAVPDGDSSEDEGGMDPASFFVHRVGEGDDEEEEGEEEDAPPGTPRSLADEGDEEEGVGGGDDDEDHVAANIDSTAEPLLPPPAASRPLPFLPLGARKAHLQQSLARAHGAYSKVRPSPGRAGAAAPSAGDADPSGEMKAGAAAAAASMKQSAPRVGENLDDPAALVASGIGAIRKTLAEIEAELRAQEPELADAAAAVARAAVVASEFRDGTVARAAAPGRPAGNASSRPLPGGRAVPVSLPAPAAVPAAAAAKGVALSRPGPRGAVPVPVPMPVPGKAQGAASVPKPAVGQQQPAREVRGR